MPGSGMNSDVTRGETSRLWPSPDGRSITFSAPVDGAYELWRIAVADGEVERLTDGPPLHLRAGTPSPARAAGPRIAYLRSSADRAARPVAPRTAPGEPRRLTSFNADVLDELTLIEPVERHREVDGRASRAGSSRPAGSGSRSSPRSTAARTRCTAGRRSWEFQILAASGIGRLLLQPARLGGLRPGLQRRATTATGARARCATCWPASTRSWPTGWPTRTGSGVTGGSYGGYLTNWIVGHDDRFAAAMTCRSVSDMTMLFLTGDISGGDWATLEFDATPWSDPAYYREISPITYADRIRTPLLIQHSERDIRTTIGQAEALFTVLRSHRRPVRLLRVPEETHELTRSGTPFRRVENLRIVRDWFRHFLVDGQARPAAAAQGPRRALADWASLERPGVSSPSHDGHQAPRQPRPRARPRADPCVGRAAARSAARSAACSGGSARSTRSASSSGSTRSRGGRSRRRRSCGRSTWRSG